MIMKFYKGPAATEVLRKGLDDLTEVCQHTLDVFEVSQFIIFRLVFSQR